VGVDWWHFLADIEHRDPVSLVYYRANAHAYSYYTSELSESGSADTRYPLRK